MKNEKVLPCKSAGSKAYSKLARLALSMMLALALSVAGFGCTSNSSSDEAEPASANDTSVEPSADNSSDTAKTTPEKSVEWEKYLDDYEAWTVEYLAFMDTFIADPQNTELNSEFSTWSEEAGDWVKDGSEIRKQLSEEEKTEFDSRSRALDKKVADAMAELLNSL